MASSIGHPPTGHDNTRNGNKDTDRGGRLISKRAKYWPDEDDDSSPISTALSMAPAQSPKVVTGPLKPVRSIALELDHHANGGSSHDDDGETHFSKNARSHNNDTEEWHDRNAHPDNIIRGSFREEDQYSPDNDPPRVERASTPFYVDQTHEFTSDDGDISKYDGLADSEFSNDREGSIRATKSALVPKLQGFPYIEQPDSRPLGVSIKCGSPNLIEDGEWGTDPGSSVWSVSNTGLHDDGASDPLDDFKNKIKVEKCEEQGGQTVDSPTLGTGFVAQRSNFRGLEPPVETRSPISPNFTIKTFETASTSTWAERNLHVPFLPEKLWMHGISEEGQQGGGKGVGEPKEPVSAFDTDSSEDDIPPQEKTRKAIAKKFLKGGFMKNGSSTIITGLKDKLRASGPGIAANKPRPSKSKLTELTGERISPPKPVAIGSAAAKADPHISSDKGKSGDETLVSLEVQQNSSETIPDGLRSHPVRRAATVPTRKKVTISIPAELALNDRHRLIRQTSVTTPYPGRPSNTAEESSLQTRHERREALLTIVLRNRQTRVPVTKKIVIPGGRGMTLADSSDEQNPPIMATLTTRYDDAKLGKLIRQEYASMRGKIRTILSARNVRDVKIFTYNTTSDLIENLGSNAQNPFVAPANRDLGEAQMLALYRKPSSGICKHAWLEWIAEMHGQSANRASRRQNLALELVEGWNIWKILGTLGTMIVLSVAATLIWSFVGVGGDPQGRINTGFIFGALVLLVGWTISAAWALLSWLT